MAINVTTVIKSISADGTATGYLTVDSNIQFIPGAVVFLKSNTQASARGVVTDLVGTTSVGVRLDGMGLTYGRSNLSAFLVADSASITMPAQTVFGSDYNEATDITIQTADDSHHTLIAQNTSLLTFTSKAGTTLMTLDESGNMVLTGSITATGGGGGGGISIGTANGLSLAGTVLSLAAASASSAGALTTGTQTIAGPKTLQDSGTPLTVNSTDASGNSTTLVVQNSGGSFGLPIISLQLGATVEGQIIGYGSSAFGLINGLNLDVPSGKSLGVRINNVSSLTGSASGWSILSSQTAAGTGTDFTLNTANTRTAGLLLDVQNNTTSAFKVDTTGKATVAGNLAVGTTGSVLSDSSGTLTIAGGASSGNKAVIIKYATNTGNNSDRVLTIRSPNDGVTDMMYVDGFGMQLNSHNLGGVANLTATTIQGNGAFNATSLRLQGAWATGTPGLNAVKISNTNGTLAKGENLVAYYKDSESTVIRQLDATGKDIFPVGGAAAVVGQATLVGGTVTVSTTAVNSASLIYLTHAGTATGNLGHLYVGTITAGTSFVINSSNASDTDKVNWWIVN